MLHLNRRMALAALLAANPIAFAFKAVAQTNDEAPPGTGLAGAPPLEDDEEVPITLDAWTDVYGRPTASTMINGQGPFAFLVDTGSTTTVIAERVALQLGLTGTGTVTVAGTTGTATSPTTTLDKLQAGVVTREALRVAILPDPGLTRGDGILGADVFAGRRLTFAIRDKIVKIGPTRRSIYGRSRANLRLRNGMLAEIDGRVGNVPAKLMLDTGADHCIANLALGEELRKRHPHLVRVPNARIMGVTGHKIRGDYVVLPRVDVKAFLVSDAGAVIVDAPIFRHWQLLSEPAMIVGINLLSRLSEFSIDYGARQFDAEVASLDDLIALNPAAFG